MKRVFYLSIASFAVVAALASCDKPAEPVVPEEPEEELPLIELLSPEAESSFDMAEVEKLEFSWTNVENVNSYKILLSLKEDMSGAVEIVATKNPYEVKAETIDAKLSALGIRYEAEKVLYWSVAVYGSQENAADTQVRKITIKRAP